MAHLRFHIRFPEEGIRQPIIYQIGREYNVVTDVRRADVRDTTGWADVEFSEHRRDPSAHSKACVKKAAASIRLN